MPTCFFERKERCFMGYRTRMLIFLMCMTVIAGMGCATSRSHFSVFGDRSERQLFLIAGFNNESEEVLSGSGNLEWVFAQVDVHSDSLYDADEGIGTDKFETIPDPLEPMNRAFFHFNDKLYLWLLKPIAKGYKWVVPEPIRESIHNFFSNLAMPVRGVNCLLQGKIKGFGTEMTRFFLNSTLGVAGFGDPAKVLLNIEERDEDFGQTLGFFGIGPGIYINWPIFGPSSIRDSIGSAGDAFLDPMHYVIPHTKYNISIKGGSLVNETSLRLGEYESLKKSALDPYISLRDAYNQYRINKIKK
jgi:phospholipid-binding lipoprotein MlaA